jgi:hypothetical protein
LEEVNNSNRFDKQEMLMWEQQPAAMKTNYNLARAYFERIIKATNTYEKNAGEGWPDAIAMNPPTKWPKSETRSANTSSS